MDAGSRRAILAALSANLGIALAKTLAFIVTGAASMLAEAVHSFADTGNQALLLWGGAAASRAPTPSHPFGFGRERYFWAFVVSLVLFTLGGLFAAYEGIQKLIHPHPLTSTAWALGVLAVSMVLESLSLRTAIRETRRQKGEVGWWTFVRRTKNPELPVVLLEDVGALSGLTLAFVGIGLAAITGDPRFDAMGSIAIGLLLIAVASVLAMEMKSLLIGEAASAKDLERVGQAILEVPEVRRLIHMRTQHMGPDELLVGAKVEFDAGLTFRELADAIDTVEAGIRSAVSCARIIYIEPDVYDPAEVT